MGYETISYTQNVEVNLPFKPANHQGKKRKLSVDWSSSDLPTVPVLTNKKAIKQHTRLMVFQAPVETKSK